LDAVLALGDLLVHRALRREARALLVDVGELHGVAGAPLAGFRLLLARDHAEQRGLAGAVRADHADDAARRQREREVVDQEPIAVAPAQPLGLHHQAAEAGAGRDRDLDRLRQALLFFGAQRLERLDARLALGLTRPGRHAHPLELALQRALARSGLLLLEREAALLLVEPRGVVALPGN